MLRCLVYVHGILYIRYLTIANDRIAGEGVNTAPGP